MSAGKRIRVEDAYALRTPDDSVRLYAEWASSYDTDFVADNGYVLHERVAAILAEYLDPSAGPVVDVGCGTGIVGVSLNRRGFRVIHGMDISKEMLAEAGAKVSGSGEPVYQQLMQADLTQPTDVESNAYAGLVSSGTFTHGHLGPGPMDELWRIAAPGAVCAVSINAKHFAEKGFARRLSDDEKNQTLAMIDLVEVRIYENPPENLSAASDKALIAVCRLN